MIVVFCCMINSEVPLADLRTFTFREGVTPGSVIDGGVVCGYAGILRAGTCGLEMHPAVAIWLASSNMFTPSRRQGLGNSIS